MSADSRELLEITSDDLTLEPLDEGHQLGHGDTQLVDTHAFRKCSISTKITDLRRCYFKNSYTGKQREACIVFFQIEVGKQKQRSNQRLTSLSIEAMFEEDDEAENTKQSSPKLIKVDDPELLCKMLYPRSARGSTSIRKVSREIKAEIAPTVMNVSVGGGSLGRQVTKTESCFSSLKSSSAGEMGMQIDLNENSNDRDGVPDMLRFAVLLQTDGLPFSVQLTFRGMTPYLGMRIGARTELHIGHKYLWIRSPTDEGLKHCDDTDSEDFLRWVKSKTKNTWAQDSDYES